MGILRSDPDRRPPTYQRRCRLCGVAFSGERVSPILEGMTEHMFATGHRDWIREDRPRDPMEGIQTEQMGAVGIISNRAEPRDKDKANNSLRLVKDSDKNNVDD